MAVGLMLMSWTALPIIYFLLVRKKKTVEENEMLADRSEKNMKGDR
jgi:hypothetical protein